MVPRLALRRWLESDTQLLDDLNSTEDVTKRLGKISPHDNTRVITLDGGAVGVVGLMREHWSGKEQLELVCAILPPARRNRVAVRASKLLLEDPVAATAPEIVACIDGDNKNAHGLIELLGFERIGTRPSGASIWRRITTPDA